MISAVGEPTEIHVTTREWLNNSDELIIEGLDLGLGNIKGETERIDRVVGGHDSMSRMGQTGTDQ